MVRDLESLNNLMYVLSNYRLHKHEDDGGGGLPLQKTSTP